MDQSRGLFGSLRGRLFGRRSAQPAEQEPTPRPRGRSSLREIACSQAGTSRRRWFTNSCFDLFVWLDENDHIVQIQLAYEKETDGERVLSWKRDSGYAHDGVDSGDDARLGKASPILVSDSSFDARVIRARFLEHCTTIDANIADFVAERIGQYQA